MIDSLIITLRSLWNMCLSLDVPTASVIILGLTLIVVVHYTAATLGLWKEAKFQSDLGLSPLIFLRYDEHRRIFIIENLGRGPAVDIGISPTKIYLTDVNVCWELKFDSMSYLKSKEEKELSYKGYENGKDAGKDGGELVFYYIVPSRRNDYKKRHIRLTIEYKNALGHKYYSVIETGGRDVKILKITRKKFSTWIPHIIREYYWNAYIHVEVYYYRRFIHKIIPKKRTRPGKI